jgi:spore germination protein YaaH
MDRKTKQGVIAASVALIIIAIVISVAVIQKLTPSKERMELSEYYVVEDGQAMVIMQDKIFDETGLYEDGTVYLGYETVVEMFNKRIYWDANENVLIYTTPTEIMKAEPLSKDYYINKNKVSMNNPIVKIKGDKVYVSLDFVQEYSDMRYDFYENPNRIVIQYNWSDYLVTSVKKPTVLRFDASIKSDIILDLTVGQKLTYVDTSDVIAKGFSKVMTEDGIIGYVKNKQVAEAQYEKLESDYVAPEYVSIKKDGPINMVWHQVTNMTANNNLVGLLEKTKGVTTVSPTWFKVESNEGTISSLADESYVERAHSMGIEVWALIDDFSTEVSMYEVLSYTSRREKLINALISEAIKYNLDGINIDFEKITLEAGKHYIQFIRELSVKCRSNNIVLSIDNYVPMNYSAYYDIAEQGTVADYVIIMAYDEHFGGSETSGSVASIGFVENAIKNSLALAPKEKVIMGVPFYTRLWKEVTENGEVKVSSEAYSMSNGMAVLKDNGVEPIWDEATGQYYGEFEKDGAVYKMWLEEDESIEAKLKLIDAANVKGIAGWKLGLEKESVWNVIIKYVN